MKTQDREKLVQCIMALCAAYGREADTYALRAYEIGLDDIPIEAINRAVVRALKASKFMPTVAELRELAGELSPRARAALAWEPFARATLSGFHNSVDFDDPVFNATVRNLGGWQRVCSIDDRKEFEVFLRKDFERVYVALSERGELSAEQAAPLIGYLEAQNRLNGYDGIEFNGVPINQVQRIETGLPPATVQITASPKMEPLGIRAELRRVGV